MKTNIYMLFLIVLACIAFLNDIFIYAFGISYVLGLIVASIIIISLVIYCVYKKKIVITLDFDKVDLIFLIAFCVYAFSKSILYPDFSYDTLSYHAYLQKYPFTDKVNFDFFPTRIFCTFLFPLGDRVYYIFRYLFGYRFAGIISNLSMIIFFYQFKILLNLITGKKKASSVLAFGFAFIVSSNQGYGKFYVDNMAAFFALQTIIYAFSEKDILKDRFKIYFITLLLGISIGLKISHFFYCIPIIIYILIKEKKNINKKNILDVFICAFIGVLPYFVYMLDNYIQTKSILFPYYNEIFKSEYFGYFNWKDLRFGIDGLLNKIFWVAKRGLLEMSYGDESIFSDVFFGLSYIIVLVYVITALIRKKFDKKFELTLLTFGLNFFFIQVMEGYFRYGVLVGLLLDIIALSLLSEIIEYALDRVSDYTDTLLDFYIIVEIGLSILFLMYMPDYYNASKIFVDMDKPEYTIEIDGIWGAQYDCTGFVSLVRQPDTPIVNLHREYFMTSKKTLDRWEELVTNNDIYTIVDVYDFETDLRNNYQINSILNDGFVIEEILKVYTPEEIPFMNTRSKWMLVKIKYVGEDNIFVKIPSIESKYFVK